MKLEKYTGYKATIDTPLSLSECRRRLHAEFPASPRLGIPRRAASDGGLVGRLAGRELFVALWSRQLREWLLGVNNPIYRVRAFRGRLMPSGSGTKLRGEYGYGVNTLLADFAVLGIAALVGLGWLSIAIADLSQGSSTGWFLLTGAVLIYTGIAVFLVKSDERQFVQERDYIVGYLVRVLEAGSADTPGGGGLSQDGGSHPDR